MLAFIAIIVLLVWILPAWLSIPLLFSLAAMAFGLVWCWGAALITFVFMRFAWWRRCAVAVFAMVCAVAYTLWFTSVIGLLL